MVPRIPSLVSLLCSLAACTIEYPDEFANGGGSGPAVSLTGASTSTDDATDATDSTDAGLDTAGCDPLLDPLDACGPGLTCDLDTLTCVPREGAGLVDDPCTSDDTCSPGLTCVDARCRALCDPEADPTCADDEQCIHAEDPIPGLCYESCDLIAQVCTQPGDACNTALGPNLAPVAVCTPNPGSAVEGDACELDGDCAPGYLCTLAQAHTLPCAANAAACCAPICDLLSLLCLGLEPVCVPLGIEGQDSAGYCGV